MNAVVTGARAEGAEVTEIAAVLAKWYADHSPVRRLLAIEDHLELMVLVTLEPTSDGDDTLPVWLAHNRQWHIDLQLRLRREVQLQLVISDSFDQSYANRDTVAIAVISWRDSWTTP